MGVPGTQTFDITFTIAAASPNVTDTAYITIDPRSGVTDPILDNNCSNAGYVGDNGGTVSTGDPQKGTGNCPGTNASQVEQVTFTEFAGSVDIHETDKKCSAIGRCIHFAYNSDPSVPPPDFTKVFVMNLAAITAAGQTYGSVGIFWVEGNTVLSSCGANPATNPCVTDKTKFKIGGATFVKITIYGKAVPDGGYGWQ